MALEQLERETRTPGRPRSEVSRKAVLDATHALLETMSVRSVTIEAIAQKAGVGKTTIYRWWSSKSAVVIEVFLDLMIPSNPVPVADSAADAICQHLALLVKQYSGEIGRIVAQLLAEGQFEPETLAEFRKRFFLQRRASVREVVDQGLKSGEFKTDLDVDTVIDMLYGAVYFRLVIGHMPLDEEFGRSLPAMAMRILCGDQPAPSASSLPRRPRKVRES